MAATGAIRAGRAFVEVFADDRKLVRGLKRAQQRLAAFGAGMQSAGRKMALIGAAATAPFALATRTFASFADQMSKVRAVTGATDAQWATLTETAKRLGRTTSFTASQVAAAMVELGRAGFKPQEIDTAIDSMLALARATDTDLAGAAEIAGNVLRGFNLEAGEMGRVADVLTAAANSSATTVEDLGEGLKYVAPLAVEAGARLEDIAAAMGVLANNGIKGTLAGNALARAYKNLATEGAQAQLAEIGVQAVDAAGNIRPLAEIIGELGDKTKNMGSAKKLAIFESLFGRGQAAALKLAGPEARLEDLQAVLEQSAGVAQRTAAQMDDNIGGSFRMIASAAEGVQIAIGEAIQGPLRRLVALGTDALGLVTEWIAANRQWVTAAAAVAAGVLATGAALFTVGTAAKVLAAGFGVLAKILPIVGVGFKLVGAAISFMMSPIGLVIAGVALLVGWILHATGAGAKALGWLGEKWGVLKDDAADAMGGITDALMAGDLRAAAKMLWTFLRLQWSQGTGWLANIWGKGLNWLTKVFTQAWSGVKVIFNSVVWALEAAWSNTTAFFAQSWYWFVDIFNATWSTMKAAAEKAWNWIKKLFGKMTEEEYRAANELIEREKQAAIEASRVEREQRSADREAERVKQRTAQDREYDDTLANIVEQQRLREKALDDEQAAKEKANRDAAAAARKEFDDAVAAAKKARREKEKGGDDAPAAGEFDPKKVLDQVKAGLDGLASLAGKALSVRGTFNAMALQSLAGGTAADRTAKATEQTAKGVNKIVRKMDDGDTFD